MRKIVAANWKMNLRRESAATLAGALAGDLRQLWLFPAAVHLNSVRLQLSDTKILLGAQDLSVHKDGAHTGDISAEMLKDCGCEMVIIGHSERRQGYSEGSDILLRKLVRACSAGLRPLFCVGESKAERDGGQANAVVESQLLILKRLAPEARAMVAAVAYEPVWAIGTGINATLAQIEEMHAVVARKLGSIGMHATPILYGGSVTPDNARELLTSRSVDGVLVGGASLNYDALSRIDDFAKAQEIAPRGVSTQLEPAPPPEALALLFERDTDDFNIEVKVKPAAPASIVAEVPTTPPSDGALSRYEQELGLRKPPTQPLPRTSQGRLQPVAPTSQGKLPPVRPVSQGAVPVAGDISRKATAPLPTPAPAKPTTPVAPKPASEAPTAEVKPEAPGAKTDKPEKPDTSKNSGPAKKSNIYDDTDRPSWV
ncbi:MAG: hypothetical protein BroJett014_15600 [Planctomycetota bacterium]|nr:triose-phosphate isomerase [Planctomycetota bacterium]GIK52587.1 MAG: hypothetical protein BroJett014_15600 [Planctomycetota bacterium]